MVGLLNLFLLLTRQVVVVDGLVGPLMVNHEIPATEQVTVDVPGLEELLVFGTP